MEKCNVLNKYNEFDYYIWGTKVAKTHPIAPPKSCQTVKPEDDWCYRTFSDNLRYLETDKPYPPAVYRFSSDREVLISKVSLFFADKRFWEKSKKWEIINRFLLHVSLYRPYSAVL